MSETKRAYKFLRDDWRSGAGTEGPWTVGERRDHKGTVIICESGYHSSDDPLDALTYAQGDVLALVEIPVPLPEHQQSDKQVTPWLKVLAGQNIARKLRLFACDCAEWALDRVEKSDGIVDPRSRAAIAVARRFAIGEATREELTADWDADRAATWDAAWAARDAAWAAARSAARDAAWREEIAWQRARLRELVASLFANALKVTP